MLKKIELKLDDTDKTFNKSTLFKYSANCNNLNIMILKAVP